jgi:hypothetical protein
MFQNLTDFDCGLLAGLVCAGVADVLAPGSGIGHVFAAVALFSFWKLTRSAA